MKLPDLNELFPSTRKHLEMLRDNALAERHLAGLPVPSELPAVKATFEPSNTLGEYNPAENTAYFNLFHLLERALFLRQHPFMRLAFEYIVRSEKTSTTLGTLVNDLAGDEAALTLTELADVAKTQIIEPEYAIRSQGNPFFSRRSPMRHAERFAAYVLNGRLAEDIWQTARELDLDELASCRGYGRLKSTMAHEMHHAGFEEGLLSYVAENVGSKIYSSEDNTDSHKALKRAAHKLPKRELKLFLGTRIVNETGAFYCGLDAEEKNRLRTDPGPIERHIKHVLRIGKHYFTPGVYERYQHETIAASVRAHTLAFTEEPRRVFDATHDSATVHEYIEIAAGRLRYGSTSWSRPEIDSTAYSALTVGGSLPA